MADYVKRPSFKRPSFECAVRSQYTETMHVQQETHSNEASASMECGSSSVQLKQLIHRGLVLHFMVQLSFTKDADLRLAKRRMGRVHHRILYFAHFSPGISISELLAVLGVRHQNIQQPLRHLVQEGYVLARHSPEDARVKQLYCSPKGDKLLEFVSGGQRERIAQAYQSVAPQDISSYFNVMAEMLDPERREWVDRLTRLEDPTESV